MPDLSKLLAILERAQQSSAKAETEIQAVAKLWTEFGREVRRERNKREVGLRKMAIAVGISKTMLDYKERGKWLWTVAEAERVIKYFENTEAPAEVTAIEAP